MATDGPTPAPCEAGVYKNGEVVFITNTIPSNAMEGWVRKVAELSGQRVDWHFFGGRAVVKALGNIGKVLEAIEELRPLHDQLYFEAVQKLFPDSKPSDYPPPKGNV